MYQISSESLLVDDTYNTAYKHSSAGHKLSAMTIDHLDKFLGI